MKRNIILAFMAAIALSSAAQDVTLPAPSTKGGLTVMEALHQRKSTREYSDKMLSDQDLSDLVFAADGINRREEGKITSPTALNRQEIDLYVFTPKGVYFYDNRQHALMLKAEGDHRPLLNAGQDFAQTAPVACVIVGNANKFGRNDDMAKHLLATDSGIMSENIALFCAARGLATVTRASMDVPAITKLLNLSTNETPILNVLVGYPKK